MRALVLTGPGRPELVERAEPRPQEGALVRMRELGICGTDLKIVDGDVVVDYPRILGHEAVGEVVATGGRGLVDVGDRVLVDPSIACGHCRWCRDDAEHLCPHGGLMGRDLDGCFAELLEIDEAQLHRLPGHVELRGGPLIQVMATCVHGQTLVDVWPDEPVVVVGLGVSGLLHVQLLRARGVTTVVGVTRSAEKRRIAEQLGAAVTATPDEAQRVVSEATRGRGARLVVESSGALAGLQTAIDAAALGGRILQFGTISARSGELAFYQLYLKELALISARSARPRDVARAIELVADGSVTLEPLLSERFGLEGFAAALERFRDGGALKVTMHLDD